MNSLIPPLIYLVIGVVAGWAAGRFMRGNGLGLGGDIVVGVIGAFLAGYGYRLTGAELSGGLIGSTLIALAGALVLLFVVRVFARRRGGGRVWS